MFTDLDQLVTSFLEILSGVSALTGFIFVTFFLLVCFLPSIVAFFFNRKHFPKIFAANVPAILSWIAWFALLAWAVTGKRRSKDKGQQISAHDTSTIVEGDRTIKASSGKSL
ncbi:superinfection immunity protein [Microbulbifer variabilis]|uniref:superinfection immunity protein n=1 Tax=Microbulbifer variabilis TaxID=266805 RepID=UPI0003751187|nr:superinfection immunity protein [Microbulbifer variabilis]